MNNYKKEQVICLICGYETDNHQSFNSHIAHAHHIKSKDYYDTYIKNETEGLCKTCGKSTQFINMWKGYRDFCCISCMSSNKDIQQQKRDTSMKHFGVEYPHQSEIIKQNMANTNQEDLQLLEKWKSKNTPQYKTAINVWTQKDIEKRNCAIKNNLNYVVLWNKNDIITYINSFNL